MNQIQQHPLSDQWTFWIDDLGEKNTTVEKYMNNLKQLSSCNSIESFWKTYADLPSIELLQNQKISLYFMKNGIKPLWEDLRNQNGSTITIKCQKNETALLWKQLLVQMISNQSNDYINNSIINGVSVSMKCNNDILSFWINSTNSKQQQNTIHFILSLFPQLRKEDSFIKENKQHESYAK